MSSKELKNKSKSDSNNYLLKTLENGLKSLLISDPETDKSAASLLVKVGSLSDPKEYYGLAHFCEHMLFLGTENIQKKENIENIFIKIMEVQMLILQKE
jgi:insulysin